MEEGEEERRRRDRERQKGKEEWVEEYQVLWGRRERGKTTDLFTNSFVVKGETGKEG